MRMISVLSLCVLAIGLGACSNTVQGFGRDMEKAGENLQKM